MSIHGTYCTKRSYPLASELAKKRAEILAESRKQIKIVSHNGVRIAK